MERQRLKESTANNFVLYQTRLDRIRSARIEDLLRRIIGKGRKIRAEGSGIYIFTFTFPVYMLTLTFYTCLFTPTSYSYNSTLLICVYITILPLHFRRSTRLWRINLCHVWLYILENGSGHRVAENILLRPLISFCLLC